MKILQVINIQDNVSLQKFEKRKAFEVKTLLASVNLLCKNN